MAYSIHRHEPPKHHHQPIRTRGFWEVFWGLFSLKF
jgi:hypothetical protein